MYLSKVTVAKRLCRPMRKMFPPLTSSLMIHYTQCVTLRFTSSPLVPNNPHMDGFPLPPLQNERKSCPCTTARSSFGQLLSLSSTSKSKIQSTSMPNASKWTDKPIIFQFDAENVAYPLLKTFRPFDR